MHHRETRATSGHPAIASLLVAAVLLAGGSALAADGRIPVYPPASGVYPIPIPAGGSYYLTDDIVTSDTGTIIDVNANNVTLDLNGHRIEKTVDSGTLVDCSGYSGFHITNGVLARGATGIYFISTATGASFSADHLDISCYTYGIYATGSTGTGLLARVSDNTVVATSAGGMGLYLINVVNGLVLQNVMRGGSYGIYLSNTRRTTVRENTIEGPAYFGIYCNSTSNYNRLDGNIVTGSKTATNTGSGIEVDGDLNTIVANHMSDNNIGMWLYYSHDNEVSGNNVSGNTIDGMRVTGSRGNNIHHNTSSANVENGFNLSGSDYNTLQYNTANGNSQSGIRVQVDSDSNAIDWNTVSTNGVCGITLYDATSCTNIVTYNRGPGNPSCGGVTQPVWVDNNCSTNVVNATNLPW